MANRKPQAALAVPLRPVRHMATAAEPLSSTASMASAREAPNTASTLVASMLATRASAIETTDVASANTLTRKLQSAAFE